MFKKTNSLDIKQARAMIQFAEVLFPSAGTIDGLMGWVCIGICWSSDIASIFSINKLHPGIRMENRFVRTICYNLIKWFY
jgi:hypothetical protein